MKYMLLYLLVMFFALQYLTACGKNAQAASGDITAATMSRFSSAKANSCVKGSIAFSHTRLFLCTSTSGAARTTWKKVSVN